MYNGYMNFKKPCRLCAISGGMAFSLCVFIYLILSLVVSPIIAAGDGEEWTKYLGYLVSPIAICITLAVMYSYCGVPAKSLFPVRTKPKYILIGVALVFGLLFSLGGLNELFISALEKLGYVRNPSTLPDVTGWKVVPVLIVVAVLPAVGEELLFRAMILNNAEEEAGSIRAALLVGLCFSLYHGSVEQTIYQFICGCLFAFLAILSRSVTPVVIIHFLNNALIIVLTAVGVTDETGALVASQGALIAIYVLSAIALVAAIVLLIFDKPPLKRGKEGATSRFFLGAAAGLVIMAVLWIAGLF